MPNIKITYTINVLPGMRITRVKINDGQKIMGEIPGPVSNIIKGEITFFLGMEDYFEFTLDGVADIMAGNTKGSFNFEYESTKVMKIDKEFTVKNGLINVYVPKIMLP